MEILHSSLFMLFLTSLFLFSLQFIEYLIGLDRVKKDIKELQSIVKEYKHN